MTQMESALDLQSAVEDLSPLQPFKSLEDSKQLQQTKMAAEDWSKWKWNVFNVAMLDINLLMCNLFTHNFDQEILV